MGTPWLRLCCDDDDDMLLLGCFFGKIVRRCNVSTFSSVSTLHASRKSMDDTAAARCSRLPARRALRASAWRIEKTFPLSHAWAGGARAARPPSPPHLRVRGSVVHAYRQHATAAAGPAANNRDSQNSSLRRERAKAAGGCSKGSPVARRWPHCPWKRPARPPKLVGKSVVRKVEKGTTQGPRLFLMGSELSTGNLFPSVSWTTLRFT